MPAKGTKLSEEQKAKMAAGRAKNKNPETNTQPVQHEANDPNVAELTKMVLELKAQLEAKSSQPDLATLLAGAIGNQSQVSRGRLIGTTERFPTSNGYYPDPRPKLSTEPRLQRIAFDLNYELDWEVGTTQYETKDGISQKEPKFTLSLNRVILDDDGEPTPGRYGICRMVFFEDPETAKIIANQNGLPIDEDNEADFLNDMRYLRVRDWLFECFWPKVASTSQANKRETNIGGKIVEYWEVSSEGNAKIPFGDLSQRGKL